MHRFEEITKWTLSEDATIFAYSTQDEELVYIVTDTVRSPGVPRPGGGPASP